MAGPTPPFALFVIADGIDVDYLSDALKRAYKGGFEAAWEQYLVTGDYDDAPKKLENTYPEGTEAPVASSYQSPFIGKTVEDCAAWLQNAPDGVALNRDYFLVIDEFSKKSDSVQICRVLHTEGGGGFEVEYFPESTDDSTVQMNTSLGVKFDEALQRYQRNRMRDGKPDRSKGMPYDRY
ncbi:hypothetical protein F5Y04DRAFT_280758 [Hypomontagnella monticulosa]|nr:hypothetical protein F5Y04DRAFT_280758 [Hypomontagnella monticulosa]